MDRSQRLTDGTRGRTFMRFFRLEDLMTSYTNAGAPELAPRGVSTSARPQDSSRHDAAPRRRSALGIPARWFSARGIPTVGGPTPARR